MEGPAENIERGALSVHTGSANFLSWRLLPDDFPKPDSNVYLDAYRLDGTQLWRIDLGRNIRAGAHHTQFQVFDYDGYGRAEVAMKTADGTVSGTGAVIWSKPNNTGGEGPGRGVAGDVCRGSPGAEFWSVGGGAPDALLDGAGRSVGRRPSSANFLIWWDGDAHR